MKMAMRMITLVHP